jgi:hypothetical protein
MRFQLVLKHLFLALCFGSAMPLNYLLMLPIAAGTFWIDKYNVLRLYRRPARVNDEVRLW